MIVWLIGMSGAGKTAVGHRIYEALKPDHKNLVFLDGDVLRNVWQDQLDYTLKGRKRNSDMIQALCKVLDSQGIHAICSVLSIFPEAQKTNRELFSEYFEVYLEVKLDELIRRDVKGLYRKAIDDEINNVVGIDIEFPVPSDPDLRITNEGNTTLDSTVEKILNEVRKRLEQG